MQFHFSEGETLLFNKPKTWSSFDLVKKVRGTIRFKKVGHAGTLDPLATGLMIVCTGKHTKTIDLIQGQEKEYEVIFRLGATTPTYDAEMPPENLCDTSHILAADVEQKMQIFLGEIDQKPPIFSAVHINGKRAYTLARKGESVEMPTRKVHVYAFSLLHFDTPAHITARIRCSKGTYIRSLVHDLGQELGVGGYILELKRTKIGEFSLENAWELPDFIEKVKAFQAELS